MRLLTAILVFALVLLPAFAADKTISDDQIVDQVRLKLGSDPEVGGRNIDVEVHGGVVTLKGKVRKEKQREKAEKLAKKVKGVTGVTNQIVIGED
jgi:hyperosmotically inducible periplasmic protein